MSRFRFLLVWMVLTTACVNADTFPSLDGRPPSNLDELWGDFDPRSEPLEVETLAQWDEGDVVLRVVRFRVGVFKNAKSTIAAVYGFPKGASDIPGLVQIHGGGQYADAAACIANARRGYATVSIAWAGRITSSKYRVDPNGVQRFWGNRTSDPLYRLTTDWGAVDGYHAPGRNPGNQFPSVRPHSWTLDPIESPRNSGWFLNAVAARRALTFLEQQPEVDSDRLGVYGHSMGGKLTVLAATDQRVKAAAPSCGGISDRDNPSELYRATLGDDVSLRQVRCPIVFLSPANDFHGRVGDLPAAIDEIQSNQWRVTCSPQHNHQDTPRYEVATMLWFDAHLKGQFKMPDSPRAVLKLVRGHSPSLEVHVDESTPIESVDLFYTQQGKPNETPQDRDLSTHRFWHHVSPVKNGHRWVGDLPIGSTQEPLWAYANVTYALATPVSGAGYYYRPYTTDAFNLSSLLSMAWPEQLVASGVAESLDPTTTIESFEGDWQKEWFTYRIDEWSRTTNKLHDPMCAAPVDATLVLDVQSQQPNELVVMIDDHAAVVSLSGGSRFQRVVMSPSDFKNHGGQSLVGWDSVKQLKLSPAERLRAPDRQSGEARMVGQTWRGPAPQFRRLRWEKGQL